MSFSPIYSKRVLEPSFLNWKRRYVEESFRVHKAHLIMLSERKLIPKEASTKLRRGIAQLESGPELPERLPDGVEDLYFLFERDLGALIGPESAGYLHTARSRNDMDTTIFRLAQKRALLDFIEQIDSCCGAIGEKAREGIGLPVVLYTHGQPANVSTLAHYLTAFLLELLEDAALIASAVESVDRSTMGACAITTTGFAIDPARVCELLGLREPVSNSYQAISTSHWLTVPASACAQLMNDITRFAADLGHKASSEVGIVTFPDGLVQGSSIMPQKRNPVVIEHIRIQAGLARGVFAGIEALFANVPFQDVNEVADAPVEQLYGGLEIAASCLDLLGEVARAVGVDADRARAIAVELGTTTTELADSLVRDTGINFREAHEVTQAFVRSGYRKEALRDAFYRLRGDRLAYTDARIDEILSPDWFIAARKIPGGPSPEGMESVFAAADARIEALRSFVSGLRDRQESADAKLSASFSRL